MQQDNKTRAVTESNSTNVMRVLTVGFDMSLVGDVFNAVAKKSRHQYSHVVHPRFTAGNWPQNPAQQGIIFFRGKLEEPMPEPDYEFLASLEHAGIPSVHNMLLGDRVLSKLPYQDAMAYSTMIAKRLKAIYLEHQPDVVLTAFDAMHSGLALAVARACGVPAYALNFSVIPAGYMSLATQMNPGSGIKLAEHSPDKRRQLAEQALRDFESQAISARAYIAQQHNSLATVVKRVPGRVAGFFRTLSASREKDYHRFTDAKGAFSVSTAMRNLFRNSQRQKAISTFTMRTEVPEQPYVLFGLHTQPESSIDVWAPFYSNQLWVIELLSRAIPPTHKLLVKIHKSDVTSYTKAQLNKMQSFPGVQLVSPSMHARALIENCDLLIAIQGTMGLEACLLGKPVLMLGHSAVRHMPSASSIGTLSELPELVRAKLIESKPDREAIIDGFVRYLDPFLPASDNHWTKTRTADEIDGYVALFDALNRYLAQNADSGNR